VTLSLAGANGGPAEQAGACAHGRACRRAACRGTDGRPKSGSGHGSYGRPAQRALGRDLSGRRAGLLRRPLAAHCIIGLELIETFPGPRQHHHARSCGQGGAGGQQEGGRDRQDGDLSDHGVLGGTFTQASEQVWTCG